MLIIHLCLQQEHFQESSSYTNPFHSMGRWCYIFHISPDIGPHRSEPRNYAQKSRKKIYKHMIFLCRLTQDCTASRFKLSISGDTQTLHSKWEYQVLHTNSALLVGVPWQTHCIPTGNDLKHRTTHSACNSFIKYSSNTFPMRPSTEIQGHCIPNVLGEICVNLILSDTDKGNTHIIYWHLNTEMQHTESTSLTVGTTFIICFRKHSALLVTLPYGTHKQHSLQKHWYNALLEHLQIQTLHS